MPRDRYKRESISPSSDSRSSKSRTPSPQNKQRSGPSNISLIKETGKYTKGQQVRVRNRSSESDSSQNTRHRRSTPSNYSSKRETDKHSRGGDKVRDRSSESRGLSVEYTKSNRKPSPSNHSPKRERDNKHSRGGKQIDRYSESRTPDFKQNIGKKERDRNRSRSSSKEHTKSNRKPSPGNHSPKRERDEHSRGDKEIDRYSESRTPDFKQNIGKEHTKSNRKPSPSNHSPKRERDKHSRGGKEIDRYSESRTPEYKQNIGKKEKDRNRSSQSRSPSIENSKKNQRYSRGDIERDRNRYSKSKSPTWKNYRNDQRYDSSERETDKYSKGGKDRDRHHRYDSVKSRSPDESRKYQTSRLSNTERNRYKRDIKEKGLDKYSSSSKRLKNDRRYRSNSRDSRKYEDRSRRDRSTSRDTLQKKKRDKSSQKSEEDSSKSRHDKKENKRSISVDKEKKRSESGSSRSSSSSSTSSEDSVKLLKMLEKERLKAIEAKQKAKELAKATETAEEKRLRRLAKKQEKERKRKERMGWDNEYLHYTNSDNPFGDGNLLATFVWQKKLAKEGLSDASHEVLESRNRMKQEENKQELEKVKKRRLERELERQNREEENQFLQRKKEAEQFKEWERQEDQFHLEQARLRSHIRIQDGRAKPIDLLAKYISAEEEVDAVEMHEPYTYLNGLHIKDLEDLVEDIKVYMELEKGKNLDYWNDITIIVEDELQKLRKIEKDNEFEYGANRREGINQAVAQDVTSVFKGKTAAQLEALQKNIESKISAKEDGIDIGYWESLLSQLKAHMARARLRDRHQESLKRKLEVLKAEQSIPIISSDSAEPPEPPAGGTSRESATDDNNSSQSETEEQEVTTEDSIANDMLDECFTAYLGGNYSPKMLHNDEIEPGTIVCNEEDDVKRLEFARLQVTDKGKKVENIVTKEELVLRKEAQKGMGEDEAQFSVESLLDPQIYLWSDKYRPRKPRYFNRVHTGFEWNKYNQTHYDMDNPPPKIVQGYKFNIFYPDLIDKSCTPEYFLTPCPENREFAILKFHAGPPYEDIAFKIVNREWEYSYKRGFRCQFHNNIFQLWFHFKRYRYRR